MKITALDNVTCEDMGLDPHEDAHQLQDLLEGVMCCCECGGIEEDPELVLDTIRKAWRRGIAFALAGKADSITSGDWLDEDTEIEDSVEGQDRESYTDDQDRESYTHDPGVCI